MHVLQPKHLKLKSSDVEELFKKFNVSAKQLPKIKIDDKALPEGIKVGDVIKIERDECGAKAEYFRIVSD